jgi:PadR family transcriptional regulator PadR
MGNWESQLRKGLVELAVLAVIGRGETYGYKIVERLAGLGLTESTVYPVLTRLARDGCLSVRVEPSPSGPARRYYALTSGGGGKLEEMTASWTKASRFLETLLEGGIDR